MATSNPDAPSLTVSSEAIRWFHHERYRRAARRHKWVETGLCLIAVAGTQFDSTAGWWALAFGIGAVLAWLVEQTNRAPLLTQGASAPGSLTVANEQLTVEARRKSEVVDKSMVVAGWVEDHDHVVLTLRDGRTLSARVPSAKSRQALLRALGVGVADRVLRVPIYSRAGGIPAGELIAAVMAVVLLPLTAVAWGFASVAVGGILAGKVAGGAFAVLGLAALAVVATTLPTWALLWALKRRQVVVGTDGIVVEGGGRKVIPFSRIRDVELASAGVAILKKDGKKLRLPTGRTDLAFPTAASEEQVARARRLVERAKEAMEASGQSRGIEQKASWLDADERDVAAWRTKLEELGERVGDYRRPGITNDEVLDIARDANRTREQRAAAMFLIGRRRVDVEAAKTAIFACADPELAKVLQAALGGELNRRALLAEGERVRVRVSEEVPDAESGPPSEDGVSLETEASGERRAQRRA